MFARLLLLALVCQSAFAAKKVDEHDCEVCKSVISAIDASLDNKDRADVLGIEKKMQTYCDTAKGKDKTMCYYMGVGDKESGTAGGVKRDVSGALMRGINSKRLCTRMKSKDAQMCELRYEKKFDAKSADFNKMRVKELRKVCDDENIPTKGLVEKDEFVKAIKKHFNIKDEV